MDPVDSNSSKQDLDRRRYDDPVRDPMDEFSRPNTGGSSDSDLNSNANRWTPPGTGTRREDSGSSLDGASDSLNGRTYRSTPGTETPLFGADPESDFRTNPADSTDRGANKPPMSLPIDEAPTPAAEENLGTEAKPDDFSQPETDASNGPGSSSFLSDSQLRSSHLDVLSMQRLAGRTNSKSIQATQVSSSQKVQRPAQWISIPLPEGRVRL